jgi:hypothetical protein
MNASDHANIIQKFLDEADIDAGAALAALVDLLVRDHLIARARANTTALNHPTTLWNIERLIAEKMHGKPGRAGPSASGAIDPRLGALMVALVHCRERAEDEAEKARGTARGPRDEGDDEPPRMRLVRD